MMCFFCFFLYHALKSLPQTLAQITMKQPAVCHLPRYGNQDHKCMHLGTPPSAPNESFIHLVISMTHSFLSAVMKDCFQIFLQIRKFVHQSWKIFSESFFLPLPPAPSQFARPTFGVPLSVSEAAFITSLDLLFSSFSEGKPGKFVSSR